MPTAEQPVPGPSLPSRAQAATIVVEASNDPGWGMFVWLAVTLGAQPGEWCVLRWGDVALDTGTLTLRSGDRVALDTETITLLRAYQAHCAAQAAILGIEWLPDAHVFSLSPDGGTSWEPDQVRERYSRLCAGLGWNMDLDRLPQYSTKELVAAGVDLRGFNWRLQRGLSRIQRRPRA